MDVTIIVKIEGKFPTLVDQTHLTVDDPVRADAYMYHDVIGNLAREFSLRQLSNYYKQEASDASHDG